VIVRLGRLSAEAVALAQALAVLGGHSEVRELLALANVARERGPVAIDALEREEIAAGRPVIRRFSTVLRKMNSA
jgi:hypothetical protein